MNTSTYFVCFELSDDSFCVCKDNSHVLLLYVVEVSVPYHAVSIDDNKLHDSYRVG